MLGARAAIRSVGRQQVEMDFRFCFRRHGVTHFGTGFVWHLTNSEVQIQSDQELPDSGPIELRIQWPFLLQSVCPLELVIEGTVDESSYQPRVVSILNYEFRTCGDHSFEPAIARGAACDLIG